MITATTPTTTKPKVYIQAFGQFPCTACERKTTGKLADYVIGSCGGYFTWEADLTLDFHRSSPLPRGTLTSK